MIVAVCPVAFFTEDHIDMTARFLDRLHDEVDRIGVWDNGGTLDGSKMLSIWRDVEVHDAQGWRFFSMWNDGARWAREHGADVALFLNNDIEWEPGVLHALGEVLENAPEDVAIVSPEGNVEWAPVDISFSPAGLEDIDPTPAYRGLLGWCFAARPALWQIIDERYYCWWGDDELGLLMKEAGWRCVRAKGVPVSHPRAETTMRFRDDLQWMRSQDEALYNSKWS